jgi:beta-glucosidase
MTGRVFPREFLWGAATSPTQVEGNTVNEWASFIARDGSTPDEGGDHWLRFEEDASALTRLNLNSYRLGLDWGRLQHGPYHDLDETALDRYRQMLSCLRTRGVKPMITLFHFACPYWLAARGGWLAPDSPELFADFVNRLLQAGIESEHWITVNEPGVYVTMAYLMGLFPPRKRFNFFSAAKALRNLVTGHILAYRLLKARNHSAQVGIAKHFKRAIAHRSWHPLDRLSAFIIRHFFARRILHAFTFYEGDRVADFIGMNFYGKLRVQGFRDISPISGDPGGYLGRNGLLCDDMWEQDAGWLPECVAEVQAETGLPVYITECGFATGEERLRSLLLYEHLRAVEEALRRGVDIRGFFYWSLVDNFEWAEGLEKKFGLLGIDFTHPERPRTLRPAGTLLSRVAASGKVSS